ncbi:MAG: glutamine synthetase family protein [Pseudomonadales bacterium]|jgi:glutamine synthetase
MSDTIDWLAQEKIHTIECLVPDFNGISKGKSIPAEHLTGGQIRLPEAIFGQDVSGSWCEDYDLFDVADIDMVLVPDEKTLVKQPWAEGIAQCLCDCESLDGEALAIAPRTILNSITSKFESMGIKPVVAQEAEFYLLERNPDSLLPLNTAIGVSGRQPRSPRSFQMEAMAEYAPFFETLHKYTRSQGIKTAGTVQEMGQGQLEVNFHHAGALHKADEMFNFKRIARQAALKQGYYASFMSKPMTACPGSAMHIHQSLVDSETGANLFTDGEGGYSDLFYAYLGGLQKYTPHVMAILAPNVNSYRRFEGAESCPTNVEWGIDNRTTGFRLPLSDMEATRIENRIPGSDTNPYLAIAVSLVCGYLGIKEQLHPSEPITANAWDLPYTIPRTLRHSLDLLERSEQLIELLGERFVKIYVDLKHREIASFSGVVTAWEREHLLLTV